MHAGAGAQGLDLSIISLLLQVTTARSNTNLLVLRTNSSFLVTTMWDHKLKNKPEKTCEVHANFWSSGTLAFTKFGLPMPSFCSHLYLKVRTTTRRAKMIFFLLIKQFFQIPPLKYQ